MDAGLAEHLAGGLTTLARTWAIARRDGVVLGFTDHDCDLEFDGIVFRADSGMSATAVQQGTGLSVDNAEAMGALSDARIRAEDIEAGRYDGAEVRAWLVNWADVDQRALRFRGTIGELKRAGGAFHAELRGLTEALNRPVGRVYQKPCAAVLGDAACGFDLNAPGYAAVGTVVDQRDSGEIVLAGIPAQEAGWFARGRLEVLDGVGAGLSGAIKTDQVGAEGRVILLWSGLRVALVAGDAVRLVAGCDKRHQTCRLKFDNLVNFQGFPDLPGEDWQMAAPAKSGVLTGGSRR